MWEAKHLARAGGVEICARRIRRASTERATGGQPKRPDSGSSRGTPGLTRYFSGDAINWKIEQSLKRALEVCSPMRMPERLPSLVIVGRPNVGKSTLFNRLTGTRRAIVTDEPGITRDRIYGRCEWRGRALEIVDTGGIVPDDKALIPAEIFRQARVAIDNGALLVLVVDSTAGLTPLDAELARLLRTTGKPFVVAVNKVDSTLQEVNAGPFHALGV